MGIILRNLNDDSIVFYLKGADTVIRERIQSNDWIVEETENMAREGLRTLVVAQKRLSEHEYEDFLQRLLK